MAIGDNFETIIWYILAACAGDVAIKPWSPWQQRVAAIGGVALKLTPLLLPVVLIGMMIWTALPRPGTSTVQVDPNNIFVSDNAHLISAKPASKWATGWKVGSPTR